MLWNCLCRVFGVAVPVASVEPYTSYRSDDGSTLRQLVSFPNRRDKNESSEIIALFLSGIILRFRADSIGLRRSDGSENCIVSSLFFHIQ